MISFVVIAYNEELHIRDCLKSIVAQAGLETHEIIVVDDGSTDTTAELVRYMQHENKALRLIRQANCGRGAARAAGVNAARGNLIAMVDADIYLPSSWLATCLANIKEYDAVGGTAVPDGDVTFLYNKFRLLPIRAASTTTITGNNGLYRRRVFEKVEFDESLREGEDIDINHQLINSGCRIACIPDLHVEHREHKSFVKSVVWLFQSGRGATRQLFRYHQIRTPDLAFGGVIAVIAMSWVARSRHPSVARLMIPTYLLITSERHVHGRFVASGPFLYRGRYVGAVIANSLLIASYFAGRAVGLADFSHSASRKGRTRHWRRQMTYTAI